MPPKHASVNMVQRSSKHHNHKTDNALVKANTSSNVHLKKAVDLCENRLSMAQESYDVSCMKLWQTVNLGNNPSADLKQSQFDWNQKHAISGSDNVGRKIVELVAEMFEKHCQTEYPKHDLGVHGKRCCRTDCMKGKVENVETKPMLYTVYSILFEEQSTPDVKCCVSMAFASLIAKENDKVPAYERSVHVCAFRQGKNGETKQMYWKSTDKGCPLAISVNSSTGTPTKISLPERPFTSHLDLLANGPVTCQMNIFRTLGRDVKHFQSLHLSHASAIALGRFDLPESSDFMISMRHVLPSKPTIHSFQVENAGKPAALPWGDYKSAARDQNMKNAWKPASR